MNYFTAGLFGVAIFIVGFVMSLVIPLSICKKTDAISALKHAGIWMSVPIGVFIILELSPWTLSIFSEGVKSIFGMFKRSQTSTPMILSEGHGLLCYQVSL